MASTLKPQKLGRVLEDLLYVLRSIIHSTKPNSLGRLALFVVATVYLTWLCF